MEEPPSMPRPAVLPHLLALLAVLLGVATGCTTYDTAYDFGSRPATAPVGPAARVDAGILGVREGDGAAPAAVDVRVRVERTGASPVSLPDGGLRLRLGNGETVAATDVRALGAAIPAAGGAATFTATFPLPGRDPATCDLSRLVLLVDLDAAGRRESATLAFPRLSTNVVWVDPWGWPGPDYNGQPTGWRQ